MNSLQLLEQMAWNLRTSKEAVAEFAAKLTESNDPLYEMSWASDMLRHSATVSVFGACLADLERGVSVADVRDQLQDAVLRSARSPEQSTSAVHNVCGLAGQSARAELLELMEKTD